MVLWGKGGEGGGKLDSFIPSGLPQIFEPVYFQQKECLDSFYYLPYFIEIPVFNANSVEPDQTPHSVASDLALNCLSMSLLWDTRVQPVLLAEKLAFNSDAVPNTRSIIKVFHSPWLKNKCGSTAGKKDLTTFSIVLMICFELLKIIICWSSSNPFFVLWMY